MTATGLVIIETATDGWRGYDWFIGEDRLPRDDASVYRDGQGLLHARAFDPEASKQILRLRPSEIAPDIAELKVSCRWMERNALQSFVFTRAEAGGTAAIVYVFDMREWTQPWSFNEYIETLIGVCRATGIAVGGEARDATPSVESLRLPHGAAGLTVYMRATADAPLEELVEPLLETGEEIDRRTRSELESRRTRDSVVASFEFPRDVRSACEQYLVYFAEFLLDLGIEATADLRHDANRVLFTVTPRSEAEALGKIREALEIYLHLPTAPAPDPYSAAQGDIRLQQLIANIQHLRGQLALASAMLQLKDATIAQLSTAAEQQKLLSGEVVVDGVREIGKARSGGEPVLGRWVVAKEWTLWGIEFNWAEMIRSLKRQFAARDGEIPPAGHEPRQLSAGSPEAPADLPER
jgi:hypothetical protein